ncbi:hypothetical protein WS71_13565 [Burkholderia mayonis]|uniref:Phytoene dehydrogenase n=1 Tax=Burkholderia mayonis TaxID=1385591 RepID=A0A1B4FXR7_9BURK|nr:hypothetical protein WS71_13565 [Burkholderia mayonis]
MTRVAIVGGGVAGLAAGVELARRGCDVRLYEARDVVGGCASTTDVDGFRFNDGALFVALPRLLDHAFARLGLDRVACVPLRPIAVPQASWLPDGARVALGAHTPLDAWTDAAKTAAAQPWIDALARRHRLDIATLRVTSPRDHAERLGLYEGALYGLSPAARPDQQFPHVTPINGLYLAGQTTYPGFGVTTSMLSGVFAADALASLASRALR